MFPGAGGGVGHMGVQLAKAMGMRVIGVDGGCEEEAVREAGLRGVCRPHEGKGCGGRGGEDYGRERSPWGFCNSNE